MICEREIALQDRRLVHHGYRRPGYGSIEGDCFGVGYEPYERSTRAGEEFRRVREKERDCFTMKLFKLESGTVTRITVLAYRGRSVPHELVEYICGVSAPHCWERALEDEIYRVTGEIRGCECDIARMDRLIAEFSPRELGQETRAGQKAREEKEARAAEREAKRAEQRRKAAALAGRKALASAKETELKARLIAGLEEIVEKAEAADEVEAYATKLAARELVQSIGRECRKTPRVHIHPRDLARDNLFVRAGLAHRKTTDGHDWVWFDIEIA